MTRVLVAAVLLLMVSFTPANPMGGQVQQRKASPDAVAVQQVKKKIELYRYALTRRDLTTLKQIWTDDYTFTNAKGQFLSKQQRLANLQSGATELRSIEMEQEIQVRVYGHAAVATSLVTIGGRYSGHEASGQYRSLHVWVKRAGRWLLVANQLTRIEPPPAKAAR